MEIANKQIDVGGQELRFLQSGSGDPVVLIHGLFGGHFCWRRNIRAFAERHQTLAVDLPGFGESVVSPALDCSMEAQALRLLSWLEQLGLESVSLVASSWGGGVALLLAALTPRVRSLVLAAPVNPWSTLGRERVRFFSGGIGARLLRLGLPFSKPIYRVGLKRLYGDPSRISAGTVEGYSQMLLRPGRADNLLSTMRSWERDLRALGGAIERVRVPTLLIWGTKDSAVDMRSSDVLLEKLPACERLIIPGAGHLLFEEVPEEFNRPVLSFLQRVSAQSQPA
jgi:4,5:9,10-diseco-3-hydroxy-5,9,17-trioxoandrosta-1(10),2-diene-4-oate hydrolase